MEECIYCNEMRVNLRADGMCKACADGDLRPDELAAINRKPHQIRIWETLDRLGRVDQGGTLAPMSVYNQMMGLAPDVITWDTWNNLSEAEQEAVRHNANEKRVKVILVNEFDEMKAYGPLAYKIRKMKEKGNKVRMNYELNRFHKKKQEVTAK